MKRSSGWNQEVTDAQGRRRFHGAFTGGFSAGHFNTVGSEEGWTPSTFVSSRSNRAQMAPRRAEDFMDEEDDPLLGKRLETSEAFDTLQQNEKARRREAASSTAEGRQPVFQVPDELILPTTGDSVGKQLLCRMGWKDGHGIGPRMRRRKLSIGSEDEETKGDHEDDDDKEEVYVPPRNAVTKHIFPKPKTDKYGVGFDPYEDAPEFQLHKRRQEEDGQQLKPERQIVTFAQALGNRHGGSSSRVVTAFGLSALEENDDLDVYDTTSMDDFDRAIAPAGDSIKMLDMMSSSAREKKRRDTARSTTVLCSDGRPALEGFQLASKKQKPPKAVTERLQVPSDFRAYHVFDETQEATGVATVYRKYNFSTEKSGRGSVMTAKQRAQILHEDIEPKDKAATSSGGSVFDLMDPSQKEKLMDAAQMARERKPLTQSAPTEQFRANIMASISKRFVSASTSEGATTGRSQDANSIGGVKEKKSRRSEDAWAPHVLLCKRFRVKCEGQTISGGASNDDAAQDLFTTELAPHLVDLAARSRVNSGREDPAATIPPQPKPARDDEELPPLPVVAKPSTDLLRSIFEPSDASDIEEDDRDDIDTESEEELKNSSPPHEVPAFESPPRHVPSSLPSVGSTRKPSVSSDSSDSSEDSDEESDNEKNEHKHSRKRKRSSSKSKKKKKHRKRDDDDDDDARRRRKHKKSSRKTEKKHRKETRTNRFSDHESRRARSRSRSRDRRDRSSRRA